MNYREDFHDLIGNTPLVKLGHLGFPEGVNVFAKLELLNPAGSVKDRTGRAMVEAAERSGQLKPGGTIIEATAGNTGIGIAFAALNKGYRVIFAVPLKFSKEKIAIMKALGAEIIQTSREGGMLEARAKADELHAQIPNSVVMGQFINPANPAAHYETTGPEIYDDLEGQIDYFVMGAGTGGTFSGVTRYLKERNPNIKGVLADPVGSTIGGGEHADYEIEGIGNDFIADTMDISLVDMVYKVSDADAFGAVKELALREGILAGSSSGAALAGVKKLVADGYKGNIVTLFPDRADRYLSKGIFDWGE
ncbi:MAG: cysteine synthase family protein [Solobacterium sp.]|nr:cysteine synthase family protein [Solobacterium sp.]